MCDLTPAFDLSGPTISHHLKVLREAGLIDGARRGTWIYYRAIPDRMAELARPLVASLVALSVSGPWGSGAAVPACCLMSIPPARLCCLKTSFCWGR